MKFYKCLVLGAAMLFATGCATNQGVALTVSNASTYIEPMVENTGNANFDAPSKKVTFHLYSNSASGKLFSSDIKGKCSLSVKFGRGLLPIEWSEAEEHTNVEFVYKEGGTSAEGYKQADYLEGSFTYTYDGDFGLVNVYNVTVTEISGHMQA